MFAPSQEIALCSARFVVHFNINATQFNKMRIYVTHAKISIIIIKNNEMVNEQVT